jgi:hypothetical protein
LNPGIPEFHGLRVVARPFRSARAYYWQYYGSWKGWEADAPVEAQLAYRLKKITNLHLFVGTVVHDQPHVPFSTLAEESARSAEALVEEVETFEPGLYRVAKESTVSEARSGTRCSTNLLRHGASGLAIDRIRDKLTKCLENLVVSQSYREAIQAPFVEVKFVDRDDNVRA